MTDDDLEVRFVESLEIFAFQAASQLLQQAINIRHKYMAVSYQHFSPECSQILRERSPEVGCQLESRRCDHFTSSTDCAACRPWRSQFLCWHETSSSESGEAQSSGEIFALQHPGVKTLPRSTRSTPHQRVATTGAAHSPPPWLANSSYTRESSPSTGPPPPPPPPLSFLLYLQDSNPVGRDGQALELPCPSLPVFVKDMQLMCQMIGL